MNCGLPSSFLNDSACCVYCRVEMGRKVATTTKEHCYQQIQEMQTHRIDDELRVFGLFPVLQIGQIVDKRRLFEISALTEVCAL